MMHTVTLTSVTQYTGYGTASSSPTTGAQTTNTAYDATFRTYATSQTNPLHPPTVTAYDYNLGVPTSVTDANNVTIYAAYDLFGRMTKVAAPGGYTSSTHPLDCLQQILLFGSSPFRITELTQKLDAARNMTSVRAYSGLGQLTQKSYP